MAPEVVNLGRAGYDSIHARMLVDAESIRKGEAQGKILLVEHDPVYTAGRGTPPQACPEGTVSVERGGGITYHGPGQLVVYPIIRLPQRDARAWLRSLEQFGIGVCRSLGLEASASDDGTGVFVAGRKVISIGVAIRHWINTHGLAINVDVDPEAFASIQPCGLDPEIMSDLSRAAGRKISMQEATAAVLENVGTLTSRAEQQTP